MGMRVIVYAYMGMEDVEWRCIEYKYKNMLEVRVLLEGAQHALGMAVLPASSFQSDQSRSY